MRIIGIDQSLKATAIAIFDAIEGSVPGIRFVKSELFKPKSTGIYRLSDIDSWIRGEMLNHYQPDVLVREMHHMRQYGAAAYLHQVTTFIDLFTIDYDNGRLLTDKSYFILSPSSWKKMITGKGNLKKDTAYLMTINKCISKIDWAHDVPGSIDDDNVADAICLAMSGYIAKLAVSGQPLPSNVGVDSNAMKTLMNACEYGKQI